MQEADIAEDYTLPAGMILHDKYRIQQILGRGGFAIIYQCVNLSTGETVAVKEYFPSGLAKHRREQGFFCVQPFKNSVSEFETGYRHFLKEARILKECRELPGIVTVYDFFEENQTAYIVMEYIEGLTLEQYIQTNGVLSPSEVLDLFLPLLHSLKKVHEKGLIHRDISPNNIILGTDNALHLIDFGAAKIKTGSPHHHQQTIILKKGYAPPEQYMASGNVGTWSDVYALCATMYDALCGQAPLPAIDRLQKNEPFSFPNFNNIPGYFSAIIERGLALQPSARYKTLEDVIDALEHPESVESANTILESAPKKRRFLRSPQLLFLGLLFTVLAVGLLGLAYAFCTSSLQPSSPPETIVATNSPVPTATPVSSPVTTAPAILTMEDVTGLSTKKAKKKMLTLDPSIQIRIKKIYDTSQTKGCVISQSITKGTVFNAGSLPLITLTVSSGAKPAADTSPAPGITAKARASTTAKPAAKNKSTTDFDINSKRKSGSFEMD